MTTEDDEYLKALEIQRRNFEAQFGSIEDLGFQDKSKTKSTKNNKRNHSNDDDDEDQESDLNSRSSSNDDDEEEEIEMSDSQEEFEEEEEEIVKPKIIKLNSPSTLTSPFTTSSGLISKIDKKMLKSGRAPTLAELTKQKELANKQNSSSIIKESEENLENDLKLQRLLKESHILANSLEYSGVDLTLQTMDYEDPTGKARKRMLTSRIREISSINSTGLPKKLENMPMNMRKGMIKKRQERIEKFEQDAKNAGIVLSNVKKGELRDLNSGKGSTLTSDRIGTGKKIVKRVRDRGLKIHGIGKSTRNGLVISQNDIDRINNNGGNKRRGKGRR